MPALPAGCTLGRSRPSVLDIFAGNFGTKDLRTSQRHRRHLQLSDPVGRRAWVAARSGNPRSRRDRRAPGPRLGTAGPAISDTAAVPRRLGPHELGAAVRPMVNAFWNYPETVHLLPDE